MTTKPGLFARLLGRSGAPEIDERSTGAAADLPTEDLPDTPHVELLEITDPTFMAETAKGHTIVDFWAPWCGPCRAFHPIYEAVAAEHEGDVRFGRLNVDEAPRSAHLVGVQSIPTVVLFDPDGNEVERIVGVPRKMDLERLLARAAP